MDDLGVPLFLEAIYKWYIRGFYATTTHLLREAKTTVSSLGASGSEGGPGTASVGPPGKALESLDGKTSSKK